MLQEVFDEAVDELSDEQVEEVEKLVVKLHSLKRTDLYSLRSKWDPDGYAKTQGKQKIPERTRWNVWYRDNMTCVYCDDNRAMLTLDHVIPEEHGGDISERNLVTACGKCNNKKGTMSVKDFWESEWLKKKRQSRGISTTQAPPQVLIPGLGQTS